MHLRTLFALLALCAAIGPFGRPARVQDASGRDTVRLAHTQPLPFLAASAPATLSVDRTQGPQPRPPASVQATIVVAPRTAPGASVRSAAPGALAWRVYSIRAHHLGTPPPATTTLAG